MAKTPVNLASSNGQATARENAKAAQARSKLHSQDLYDNSDRLDPARDFSNVPPNMGRWMVPTVQTFAGIISTIARTYKNPDEAYKHSLDNARFMRNDIAVMECLEARQRATAGLNWHIEVDGPEMPYHKALQERLTEVTKAIPRFTEYRRCLLEAIWYGRQGIQHRFGHRLRSGRRDLLIKRWMPIMGDKLLFRQDYGVNDFPEEQVGVRVGPRYKDGDLVGERRVTPTEAGLGIFLAPYERNLMAIHKHMIEDAAYEDPLSSGSIHGIGIRSRIYWTWFQKQELLALFMEYLERSALGFEIWYYDDSNPKGREDAEQAARNRIGRRNIVLFPVKAGEERSYFVEHIEPGAQGAEALQRVLNDFFGHQIKRYILGQTLTSEAAATGLGSGVAELHLQTMLDIVKYDATNLEETITTDTVEPLKLLNDSQAGNVEVRFVIETESQNAEEKLAAYQRAYDMGAKIREKDVMEAIDSAMPEEGEPFLQKDEGGRQDGGNGTFTPPNPDKSEANLAQRITASMGDTLTDNYPAASPQISSGEGGTGGEGSEGGKSPVKRYAKTLDEAARDVEEPESPEQAEAGNYRKGHATLLGLPITIETAKGMTRRGVDSDGQPWESRMAHHYGYIKRTESDADGDHVDVFIGPDVESEAIFVIDQSKPSGRFDEHKCMIGFMNEAAARKGYQQNYSKDWKGLRAITAMTPAQFKQWLKDGDTGKPVADQVRYVRRGALRRYAASTTAGKRWITLSPHEGEDGARVLIDSDGKIHAGPKHLSGKSIDELGTGDDAPSFDPSEWEPERTPLEGKTALEASVIDAADDYELDPHDLLETAQYVWSEKRQALVEREKAKQEARSKTGLTQRDVNRLENAGYDHASAHKVGGVTAQKMRHFDVSAQELAREQPDLGLGNPDDDSQDFSGNLWRVLAEGQRQPPPKHDRSIIREAVSLLSSAQRRGPVGDLEPFARSAHGEGSSADDDLKVRFARAYLRYKHASTITHS